MFLICIGMAASMGALWQQLVQKGKDFALPNSEIMITLTFRRIPGQATDIGIHADGY